MYNVKILDVWQGVAKLGMHSLKFHPGPPCPTPETALWSGWQPWAVFYPFGHPTPYAYEVHTKILKLSWQQSRCHKMSGQVTSCQVMSWPD
jgi:hypothetical protein